MKQSMVKVRGEVRQTYIEEKRAKQSGWMNFLSLNSGGNFFSGLNGKYRAS